jgi:F-type H+-transporting ATPase subunit epsilon
VADTFEIEIATPERLLVKDDEALRAQIPAKDGYIGVLPGHAPLLSELGIGTLTYATSQGARYSMAVHGGYLEILDNHVRVLANAAEAAGEIDVEKAEEDRKRAERQLFNPGEGSDPAQALAAVLSAQARVEAAHKAAAHEE